MMSSYSSSYGRPVLHIVIGSDQVVLRWLTTHGLNDKCALLLFDKGAGQNFESVDVYGKSRREVIETIKNADLLWNDCCGVRQPLLGMFRHRVLIDLDPGHLQISAVTVNTDLQDHDTLLTVGKKLHDTDCEVPTLGFNWHTSTGTG